MPYLSHTTYHSPVWFRNDHIQTIYPALMRRVQGVEYQRERIDLPDGDFLDIDWSKVGGRQLLILCHGLEGSSDATYIKGMVRAGNQAGYDVVAMNFRGCSGEPNRLARSYHSGATEDLGFVIDNIANNQAYDALGIVGYSLGGNMVLKYLGENGSKVNSKVFAGVAYSVPCDLTSGAANLATPGITIYMRRFMRRFREKIDLKKSILEAAGFDTNQMKRCKNFKQFDDLYTAPAHGFDSAEHYWQVNGCKQYLSGIKVPALLVNAWNDPFLTKECFPFKEAEASEHFHFEAPKYGGHVGFTVFNNGGIYWSEQRALEFLNGK